jgi:hypothetical protein
MSPRKLSPEDNYRSYPEIYGDYSRDEIRKVIFFQGLSAPEHYLGGPDYEGEEAEWWWEGESWWTEMEEGADISDHPYFKK